MSNRKKIPLKTESELLFKSDMKCCVCKNNGDHIHHIDKNPSNNELDNLCFLCFTCHNKASIENSLSKSLKPLVIKKFRDEHYETIRIKLQKERSIAILQESKSQRFNVDLQLSTFAYFDIVKAYASISKEADKSDFFSKLFWYSEFNNNKIAHRVAKILMGMSYHIRCEKPEDRALDILSSIIDYFPVNYDKSDAKIEARLGEQFLDCGYNMIHDSWFDKNNMRLMCTGFLIYKTVYKGAMNKKNKLLLSIVDSFFEKTESMFKEEKNEIKRVTGLNVLNVSKEDLKESGLAFPLFSEQTNELFTLNIIYKK